MYVNGKMVFVETVPGMGRGGYEGEWWRSESKDDIFII
jgi:membrane protein implicated in regulation of membrane protease activity